jgi:hypothetical protein
MSVYARIKDGKIDKIVHSINFRLKDGSTPTEEYLIPIGVVPVDYNSHKLQIDDFYQRLNTKNQEDWTIEYGDYKGYVYDKDLDDYIEKELTNIPVRVYVEYDVISDTVDTVKAKLKNQIKQKFNESFTAGYKTSLGITVDCKKDDLLNFQGLCLYAKASGLTKVQIRDYYNNFHTIAVDDLEKIINEIIAYHLSLYQKKWNKEQELAGLTTIEQLKQFQVWD